MPSATFKNAPGLDIAFSADTPRVLYSGQTLSGKVVLSTTEKSVSIGSVTAAIYGRTKCIIIQHNGQSSAVFKSRSRLFNVTQELFRSDYTYAGGDFSWPFSFQMPFVADETCLTTKPSNLFKPDSCYLSTNDIDVIEHEMPPPMSHYHGMVGRQCWAFVEYVLEVTVTEALNAHHVRGPKSRSSTRPLNFQPGRREEILREYGLASKSKQLTFKSSRLLPTGTGLVTTAIPIQNPVSATTNQTLTPSESRDSSSLRNVLSRLSISTSTTPRIALNCTVTYPTVLQVYHPDPIPFQLTITPDLDPQATNIDPSTFPTVRLKSFDLRLICVTGARVPTVLWTERDRKTVTIYLVKDAPLNHSFSLRPSTTSTTPERRHDHTSATNFQNSLPSPNSTSSTVDLTALLPHLQSRLLSAKTGRKLFEPILVPTFRTYNIVRQFGLKWVIELEIVTPQKTWSEKLKGEVANGGVVVKGVPEVLREEAMTAAGIGGVGSDRAVEVGWEAAQGDDGDDGDDCDQDGAERRGAGVNGGMRDDKKGLRSLFGRSTNGEGGSGAAAEKNANEKEEEYARQDHTTAARAEQNDSGGGGEQLPKYEA